MKYFLAFVLAATVAVVLSLVVTSHEKHLGRAVCEIGPPKLTVVGPGRFKTLFAEDAVPINCNGYFADGISMKKETEVEIGNRFKCEVVESDSRTLFGLPEYVGISDYGSTIEARDCVREGRSA